MDFDRSQALHQIWDALQLLQHMPIPAEDLQTIQKVLQALSPLESLNREMNEAEEIEAVLESPKIRQRLKSAARTLQTLRNRAAHQPDAGQKRPRPAYDLREEDEDG